MKTFERFLYVAVRFSAVLLPVICLGGFLVGGRATYAAFLIVFGFYFFIEAVLHFSKLGIFSNKNNEFQFVSPQGGSLNSRAPLLIFSIFLLTIYPAVLYFISVRGVSTIELAGLILSFGVTAGSVGGLAAHEFIHSKNRFERAIGTALFGVVNYAHFKVSHIGGHHRNVGLHEDWSTSRKGESYYAFQRRAIVDGIRGAWNIEVRRLERIGKGPWSLENFMVSYGLILAAVHFTILRFLGLNSYWFFVGASLVAVSLIEMVNYLSHYGLIRAIRSDGRSESVGDHHSWESPNKVTNWFIFNAGKHSHHHRVPSASHDELQLAYANEFLPLGLPGMTLLAFVPSLYFRVMDPRLARLQKSVKAAPQKRRGGNGGRNRIFVKSMSEVTSAVV
jgi:alkane 1-monooxygenase